MREKSINNNLYSQMLQLSGSSNKRNYWDYINDKQKVITDNKKKTNNMVVNDINTINNKSDEINNLKENIDSKKKINAIKLKNNNNNNNISNEFKKIFNNPLKRKELTFKKNNVND